MADDKKKVEPAGLPAPFHKEHHKDTALFLLVLLFIGYIVTRFTYYFQGLEGSGLATFWDAILFGLKRIWSIWKGIALVISVFSFGWAIQSYRGASKIAKEEDAIFGAPAPAHEPTAEDKVNKKWAHVLELMNSNTPSDWRLSIIEADIMLDELLRAQQYHGDSIGDMLKSVEPSDFLTLDAAWEAHKVRNRIAHSGADFELNERETKRIIRLFESVFKEFQII